MDKKKSGDTALGPFRWQLGNKSPKREMSFFVWRELRGLISSRDNQ